MLSSQGEAAIKLAPAADLPKATLDARREAVAAFTHRAQMDLRALAVKACEDGKRAIVMPRDLLAKRGA